jgi:hypothetical protein
VEYREYERTTKFRIVFSSIDVADPFVTGDFDGFIGLLHIPKDNQLPTDQNMNFLGQMKDNNLIDKPTIAFYISLDKDVESIIKFGSYDKLGYKEGETLETFKTTKSTSWDLKAKNFVGAGRNLLKHESDERKVALDM